MTKPNKRLRNNEWIKENNNRQKQKNKQTVRQMQSSLNNSSADNISGSLCSSNSGSIEKGMEYAKNVLKIDNLHKDVITLMQIAVTSAREETIKDITPRIVDFLIGLWDIDFVNTINGNITREDVIKETENWLIKSKNKKVERW